jgi:hypothetical protein
MNLALAPVGGGEAMVRVAAGASFPRSSAVFHNVVCGGRTVGGTSKVDVCFLCWLSVAGRDCRGWLSGGDRVCLGGNGQVKSECLGGLAVVGSRTR